MTDREAIGAMKGLKLVTGTFANEALDAGISALQEREKRIEGCSFCRTVYAKGDWAEGGTHDFRLYKGVLYYNDAIFGLEGIRVNNCPMCGRRLKEGKV